MSRRYYRRHNSSGLRILIYFIFLPVILLILVIKLIIKISKRHKFEKECIKNRDSDYQDNTSQDSLYHNESEQTIYQQKESLITSYEKYFYDILEDNFGDKYKIQTQVNLASIVKKVSSSKYQNELFRNIDFGIFEKTTLKPLLMIEINDSTHKNSNRYQRDLNVRKILEESNIKLITFYSSYDNKKEYVINRIAEELVN